LVNFPVDSGAPSQIKLDVLLPLNHHHDPGVRYFSGTCRYSRSFSFKKPTGKSLRQFLDLGVVEVLSEVILNGKSCGIFWARPSLVDVTDFLSEGENNIEIRVTNLWPNRLIGDEQVTEPYQYSPGGGGSGFASLSGGAILELPDWYQNNLPKPDDGKVTFATWKHYNKSSPLLQSGLLGPVALRTSFLYKA
jgi:hypothetical protein